MKTATKSANKSDRGIRVIYQTETREHKQLLGVLVRVGEDIDGYIISVEKQEEFETWVRWYHESGDEKRQYLCKVGDTLKLPFSCSCPGFKYGGECCHCDATKALIGKGKIKVLNVLNYTLSCPSRITMKKQTSNPTMKIKGL